MLLDKIIAIKGGTVRKEQSRLFSDMQKNQTGLSLYNAGTGIGKTLAYLSATIESGSKTIIAVPNHQLAKQVMSDIEFINANAESLDIAPVAASIRYGYQEYLSPVKVETIYDAMAPESSPEQLTLLDALLAAATSSNSSNLVQAFLAEYDGLPGKLVLSDVCCSVDDKSSSYLAQQRSSEKKSEILIVSHVTLLIQSAFNSLPEAFRWASRLIVDEADGLVQTAESIYARRISVGAIKRKANLHDDLAEPTLNLIQRIEVLKDGLHFINMNPDIWISLVELTESAMEILGHHPYTDQLHRFCELSMNRAAVSKGGGKANLLQLSQFASKVFANRAVDFDSVWLLSGTLDITAEKEFSANWLCGRLGLREEPHTYGHYEPDDFGNVEFVLSRGPKPVDGDAISEQFVSYCASHVEGTMLICTSSHEETSLLAGAIRTIGRVTVIEDKQGTSLTRVIKQFQNANEPAVLISARATVGTDIRSNDGSQLFKKMMITRLPFSPPPDQGDIEWRAEVQSIPESRIRHYEYSDSIQKNVRRFIQTFGRAIRSEKDFCEVMIMDPRMPMSDSTHPHRIFRDALPKRFWMNYLNARTVDDEGREKKKSEEIFL